MKKLAKTLFLLFVVSLLVACSKNDTDKIEVEIKDSDKFSQEEIESAANTVKDNFSFPGAKLLKVRYDEKESDKNVDLYMKNGKGSIKNINPDDAIVIFTDFEVDKSEDNPVLSPGKYENYSWILIRDNGSKDWTIDDQGY